MVAVGGRRQGWRRRLLGLRLLMCRRDHDVRMLLRRRLHRLLLVLRLRMVRLGVQHPSWYRRWRQLLILHSAAHPIISRAHLITPRGISRNKPPARSPPRPVMSNAVKRDKSSEVPFTCAVDGRRARIRDVNSRREETTCYARISARGNHLDLSQAIDHRGSPPASE